jgi:hypothetical protein
VAERAALALARLQLDKNLVSRRIAAGQSVIALAAERQRIQTEIDRLTPLIQRRPY